jgi:lysophospholipase L1-like esterase
MRIFSWLKFISVCLPFTAFSQQGATNQRLFDTIPFIPEHTPQRIAGFEKEAVVSGRVLFLGNSITEMGEWGKLSGDTTIINRGIGGDITFGLLKRLDDVIKRKPSKLFLLIGINDIGKDIPDAVIAGNIRRIIETIQSGSPATIIYLETILPVNPGVPGLPQHYDKNEHVRAVNKLLPVVAADMKVTLIDTYSLFAGSDGLFRKEYTPEGLHVNKAGYTMWVQFLKEKRYL